MSHICVCEMNVDGMPTKLNLICNAGPSQGKWQAINRLWPLSTGWGGCYGLSPPLPDLGRIWVCFDCYQPGPKVWVAGWYLCSFVHVEHAILLTVKSLRWSAYIACPSPTLNMVWLLPQFELVKSFHMRFFVLIGRKLRSDFSVANWLNSGVTCVMYLFPFCCRKSNKEFPNIEHYCEHKAVEVCKKYTLVWKVARSKIVHNALLWWLFLCFSHLERIKHVLRFLSNHLSAFFWKLLNLMSEIFSWTIVSCQYFGLAGIHQSIKRNAVFKRMEKACVNHLGSEGPMAGLSWCGGLCKVGQCKTGATARGILS